MELGIMRVSGAAGVLERAAEKLGVAVPDDPNRLYRAQLAVESEYASMFGKRISTDHARRLVACVLEVIGAP